MSHCPTRRTGETSGTNRQTVKMKYSLEKYKGRHSRHECPKCKDKHSFTYYVDENGNILDKSVGRCNHESSCGYHYTPKEYYKDHKNIEKQFNHTSFQIKGRNEVNKKLCYIPTDYLINSLSYHNDLCRFIINLFSSKNNVQAHLIEMLMTNYFLGSTKNQCVIFWQVDNKQRIRTGKIMRYDPITGHRIKNDKGGINWVHCIMKKQKLLPNEWELTQCLFGEHLLSKYPGKVVALTESEKSAIICSLIYPEYIWLATGGKSQLSHNKLKVLQDRNVIMFPDVDGYEYWLKRSKEMHYCKVYVSSVLEKYATPKEREEKIDIADWLIAQLRENKNLCISISGVGLQ